MNESGELTRVDIDWAAGQSTRLGLFERMMITGVALIGAEAV